MMRIACLAVAITLLLLTQPAAAVQLAEETFTPSFPVYANGGSGFSGAWTVGGFNAGAAGYTARAKSLCYPHLVTTGGSVSGDASFLSLLSLRSPLSLRPGDNVAPGAAESTCGAGFTSSSDDTSMRSTTGEPVTAIGWAFGTTISDARTTFSALG